MTYQIGRQVPLDYARTIIGDKMSKPIWYALQVPPQREHIAREALKAKGVHACYPERETTWRMKTGKRMSRKYPVVSQIVYAKFTHAPQWDVLKHRRIITGVFSWGQTPIAIPGDTIRVIMGLPTEAERIEAAQRELMRVREGDKATLKDGPFAGHTVDVRTIKGGIAWFEMLTGVKGSARVETLERNLAANG